MLHKAAVVLAANDAWVVFQRAPTLGGECYWIRFPAQSRDAARFQRAPTLGGECYSPRTMLSTGDGIARGSFNGHPPLGVNATGKLYAHSKYGDTYVEFQRAPTLGGECYALLLHRQRRLLRRFNGHPPLGVNATRALGDLGVRDAESFNGHPPLGVNATKMLFMWDTTSDHTQFQRAPTLGGECYQRAG